MSKRSDLWHQAQNCLSLARATADPALKELYEDMALEFAHTAARDRDTENVKTLDTQSGNTGAQK
jgi:hypothetical protein